MQERISFGPDRLTLVLGFADMKEITFYLGGACTSSKRVIIEEMSHTDNTIDHFDIRGHFVEDMKKFTGHYKTTNQTGKMKW